MEKREPTDKDWQRLFSGISLSEQDKLYLSYNHCSNCGCKIDWKPGKIVGDGVYCIHCIN